jgi:hypothetical protein
MLDGLASDYALVALLILVEEDLLDLVLVTDRPLIKRALDPLVGNFFAQL